MAKSLLEKKNLLAALFMVFIFVIGVMNIDDYGVYCDYESEMPIVFMNIQAYGRVVFGDDSGYVQGLGDNDVLTDIERDHGAAALYLIIPFSMIPHLRNDAHTWMLTFRMVIFTMFWLGLIALYFLIRRMTGSRLLGCLGAAMLWLSPRFFAESTYNNKDLLALACTIFVLYSGYMFLKGSDRDFAWPAVFAFTSAMNINMRVTGCALYGLVGIFYIIYIFVNKKVSVKAFLRGLEALITMPLFYVILTPATWHGNLFSFLEYLITNSSGFERTAVDLFMNGEVYNSVLCPPGRSYIFRYILVTTPPVILLFSVIGVVTTVLVSIRRKGDALAEDADNAKNAVRTDDPDSSESAVKTDNGNDVKKEAGCSLLYRWLVIVFFVTMVVVTLALDPAFYNGWRHMYFLYPAVILLAVYGLKDMADAGKKQRICALVLVSCQLLASCIFIISNHPLEFAYYNFLAGNSPETDWDGDYWGVGTNVVLEEMADKLGPCSAMIHEEVFGRLNLEQLPEDVAAKITLYGWWDMRSDYIIVNRYYDNLAIAKVDADWSTFTDYDAAVQLALLNEEPVMTFSSGDMVLYEVYVNPFR